MTNCGVLFSSSLFAGAVFNMDPLVKATLLRTFGFLIWVFLSAWVFVLVEDTEKDDRKEKYELLRSLYHAMALKYNMSVEEFNNFSSVAYEALSKPKLPWSFSYAFDFVLQAVTTIGYGYITPQTATGQMLCIFVSLLGIPITMLSLKSAGELIAKFTNTIVTAFEKKILKKAEPKQVKTKSAVILFTFMVFLIVGNALVVSSHQDWTFVQGVYYWFVTLSTIGFGDYVTRKPKEIKITFLKLDDELGDLGQASSKVVISIAFMINILLGLCIVSSVLNAIMVAMEEVKLRPRCPRRVPRKTQDLVQTPKQLHDVNMTSLSTENVGFRTENMESVND